MQLKQLVNPEFFQAVNLICNQPVGMVLAYKLSEMLDKIKKEREKYEELRQRLLKQFGEPDETGNLKTNESKTEYLLKDPVAFAKEFKALEDIEVEIPQVSAKELEVNGVKLSGKTVSLIRDLLTP